MQKSKFYSDYACTLIELWPQEVAQLIHEFALHTPAAQKKAALTPYAVTSGQIIEAIADSHNLAKEYLAANAAWQKVLNSTAIPKDIVGKLEEWRTKDLNPLMGKWRKAWHEQNAKFADEIITTLKTKCNMELSEFEQAELKNPTRSKEELLLDLNNFFPKGLPKGYDEDSPAYKLRALWAQGAYQHRTLTRGA